MSVHSAPALLVPTALNARYELSETCFEGGFAFVYRAYDAKLGRDVALKVLKPERIRDERWRDNIRQEARNWAKIPSHPNVVQVFDVGVDETTNYDYLVLEWVDGPTLYAWREKTLGVRDMETLLDLAVDCCKGIEAIHAQGLVHGDITPRNILLTGKNNLFSAKLTDFGLAWDTDLGRPVRMGGTLRYAAPEQLSRGQAVDHRTDIYSLATVLFYLFSGTYYLGEISEDEDVLRTAIVEKSPLSLKTVQGACNTDLDELIACMLEKDHVKRPAAVSDVLERLQAIRDTYIGRAAPTPAIAPSPKIQDFPEPLEIELHIPSSVFNYIKEHIGSKFPDQTPIHRKLVNAIDADDVVDALLGTGVEYDCYLFNDGPGKEADEQRIKVVLATDAANSNYEQRFRPVSKTFQFTCVQSPDRRHALLLSASLVAVDDGIRKPDNFRARLRFAGRDSGTRAKRGFPPTIISRIGLLPRSDEPDADVVRRIAHWKAYLTVWERIAKDKEWEAHFNGWEIDPEDSMRLRFRLRHDSPWRRIELTRRQDAQIKLRIYYTEEELYRQYNSGRSIDKLDEFHDLPLYLGTIYRVHEERRFVSVRINDDFMEQYWDYEKNTLKIETEGVLAYVATGDLAQIRFQRSALEQLERGETLNPRLNKFLFDAGQAEYPDNNRTTLRRDQLLLSSLNENQLRAVEGALSAPDLFLIQGPPGTGKTTVIAELCFQLAKQNKRILVSSQSNLAVDNALSRLAHHPSILALRVGRVESVEQEGRPFIEEEVVQTWFERTATDCERQIVDREDRLDRFASLFKDVGRLEHYSSFLSDYTTRMPQLLAEVDETNGQLELEQQRYQEIERLQKEVPVLFSLLEQTTDAVRSSVIPERQSTREWRTKGIDLIALPEYQKFISSLAWTYEALYTLNGKELVGLDAVLYRDERNLLRQVCHGLPDATRWSHRPPAFLYAAYLLRTLLTQTFTDLERLLKLWEPLQTDIERHTESHLFLSRIERLQHLLGDLQAREEVEQEVRAVCRKLKASLQLNSLANQLNRVVSENKKALAASTKIETLRVDASLSEMSSRQLLIRELLETLDQYFRVSQEYGTTVVGKPADAVIPRNQTSSLRQLKEEIQNLDDLIYKSRIAFGHLGDALPQLAEWLSEKLPEESVADLEARIPLPLLTTIKTHPLPYTEHVILLRQLRNIVNQTIADYQKLLPQPYLLRVDEAHFDTGHRLHWQVASLFHERAKGTGSLLAKDIARTPNLFSEICTQCTDALKSNTLSGNRDEGFELALREYRYLIHIGNGFEQQQRHHLEEAVRKLRSSGELKTETVKIIHNFISNSEQELMDCLQAVVSVLAQENEVYGQAVERTVQDLNDTISQLLSEINELRERVLRLPAVDNERAPHDVEAVENLMEHLRAGDVENGLAIGKKLIRSLKKHRTSLSELAQHEASELGVPNLSYQMLDDSRQKGQQALLSLEDQISGAIEKLGNHPLFADLPRDATVALDRWKDVLQAAERIYQEGQIHHAAIAPEQILLELYKGVQKWEKSLLHEREVAEKRVQEMRTNADAATERLSELQSAFEIERDWWESRHAAIPLQLRTDLGDPDTIHEPPYINLAIQRLHTETWKVELNRQMDVVDRTKHIVQDWIQRLREPEPGDAESVRQLYVQNANVLGVTCGQVPKLKRMQPDISFDVAIIDEVSKATPPELILPMLVAKKVILVGDHKQLPPMIEENSLTEIAENLEISLDDLTHLKQSLFGNLFNSTPRALRCMLTEQYRMRPEIMHAINQFYDHKLSGGHDRSHNLTIPGIEPSTAIAWYKTPREDGYFEQPVVHSYTNPAEISVIEKLLQEMNRAWLPYVKNGIAPKQVGLITFYTAQLREFRQRFSGNLFPALSLRIGTVDRFQGMERDVVIVSLVRNNPRRNIGFAKEPERINVAFSRAKELLVIVGCQTLFTQGARNAYDATAAYDQVAQVVRREGKEIDVSTLL